MSRAGRPLRLLKSADTPKPNPEPARPFTDSGNAEHFARHFGDGIRYDHRRAHWLLWTPSEHRWKRDSTGLRFQLAKQAARLRQVEAIQLGDSGEREEAIGRARAAESRHGLSATLDLARHEPPIADAGDGWDENPWLLGTPSGVVDLKTGQLREGRPEDRITLSTHTRFAPRADCLRFKRFLTEVLDRETVDFVQRAWGYCATGNVSEQVLFMLHGDGANGKTTFLNAVAHALGDYAGNIPFSTFEAHQRTSIPNDVAMLVGRRVATAAETSDGVRLNEARVKALTGGDPITARLLHQEFFTFRPTAKFWLAVNHRPVVQDDSRGFWRRVRLIPFSQTFRIDKTLSAQLQIEAPGILRWLVEGCLKWHRDGLKPPKAVAVATDAYARESDPLAEFLAFACKEGDHLKESAGDLFRCYLGWAERQGMRDRDRLSATAFGRRMAQRFQRKHSRAGEVYLGVALRVVNLRVRG